MKNKKINGELKELMDEKNNTCISIIIPLHEIPSDKKIDSIIINHAIEKLNSLLISKYKPLAAGFFVKKIKELRGKINLVTGMNGIGIFISANVLKLIQFPFPVTEKIIAGDSFEIRDVLYKELYLSDYFVLSLSMKKNHLLKGRGNVLTEVKDKIFPATYKDTYEYSKPSRGTSYGNSLKEFEKDRSIIKEIRLESFYHILDQRLNNYLDTNTPLVIAGVKKDLGYFEKNTTHKNNIVGKVLGSYDDYNSKELQSRAWEVIKKHLAQEQKKMILSIKELIGNKIVAMGIKEVWRDAKSGKANTLVVEKDLEIPAFISTNESQLFLKPPQSKHKIITDAVDDVIETVIEKKGKVVFVDNQELKDFEGIALINRY